MTGECSPGEASKAGPNEHVVKHGWVDGLVDFIDAV